MGKSTKELFVYCDNAERDVGVTPGEWQVQDGDRLRPNSNRIKEIMNTLHHGQCDQAKLPEGCPFVRTCTGKVLYNNRGLMYQYVINGSANKSQRDYLP